MLNKYLSRIEEIKQFPSAGKICLNIGCGPKGFDGFKNIDGYFEGEDVLKQDMRELSFSDCSVDLVYSSHALEHLPIRETYKALKEWYRVLNKNGRLCLAIPDLEQIMLIMLSPDVPEETKWSWYIYTLFGYQANPDEPNSIEMKVDNAQFHSMGFTPKHIQHKLKEVGFEIIECYKYDGWGTPSIYVEAVKLN